ncbi:MAG: hypothetical protein GF421_07290 [Candidatus Aminicenantes bacterium]|nr:hypothetical protein [Candidatus Aminicenantes bacterium]
MNCWSLLVENEPQKGSYNMAVDDYLFESLAKKSQTVVRFYSWKKPTVSIGCSQDIKQVLNLEFCRKNSIDIVRRITGGKLVLHFKEVTYSICSSDVQTFTSSLSKSYQLISKSLVRGLNDMGIPAYLAEGNQEAYSRSSLPCFSYPAQNEIKVKEKKIVGSAQKRTGGIFIQHGSIPLISDDQLLRSISLLEQKNEKVRMISVSQALGKGIEYSMLVPYLTSGIQKFFGIQFRVMQLAAEEKKQIRIIQKERHENPKWVFEAE